MNDSWGGICTLFAKGHHDASDFLRAASEWCKDNDEFGDDYSGLEERTELQDPVHVKTTVCRVVPCSPDEQEATGHSFLYLYPRKDGERGSFPMTYVALF
jgi:hypothetical protein